MESACCLPDGSCYVLTECECFSIGGRYRGGGTDCADPCPPNDLCVDAVPVAVPSTTSGATMVVALLSR